jgi:hypothetical protein
LWQVTEEVNASAGHLAAPTGHFTASGMLSSRAVVYMLLWLVQLLAGTCM